MPDPHTPADASLNLAVFYRLCVYISHDLHAQLFQRIVQHPDIPREAAWKRLRSAYWQASAALTGRGGLPADERRSGADCVHDLPVLAQWLALAADAMQLEIATTDWGRRLFPAPGPGDLGGRELRRLLKLL